MSTKTDTKLQTGGSCPGTGRGADFWGGERAEAWFGLMETHARLVKALDADLLAGHGIGMSGYVMLARLGQSEDGKLRMSQLADRSLLSQSRVSRLADELAGRGLLERLPCDADSRVVYAAITDAGLELLEEAQETHFSHVDDRFFASLSETDVKALVRIWRRLGETPLPV